MGTTETIAMTTTAAAGLNRFCGRFLSLIASDTDSVSVCCKLYTLIVNSNHISLYPKLRTARSYPFRIGVVTNDSETCITNADNMATMCEAFELPSGLVGFALGFEQKSC